MLYRRDWERARAEIKHYRRRTPEKTALYQIVHSLRDELEYCWEDRFQATYGVLRTEVLAALDEYLNCGLLCHGAARAYCDTCKHSLLIAFSCKRRGLCPSCSSKRAVLFAEHVHHNVLLDVSHRHAVFSVPKRLRAFFRYDRSLSDILFHAAWSSLRHCLGDTGSPAAVLTLQTAGAALNFNPHLHGAVPDGVFLPDGTFKQAELDQLVLQSHFADYVLAALHTRELIDDGVVEQILSGAHTGFSAWLGDPFSDADSMRFVARYIERGPLSLEKLSLNANQVTYKTNNDTTCRFDALDFLALLTSHIPNRWESLTRYYGYYSSRSRGERAGLLEPHKTLSELPEQSQKASTAWAACMKRTLELNPLECPKCKSDMRIISFLTDTREISKIMLSLGIAQPVMPNTIPRAPPQNTTQQHP